MVSGSSTIEFGSRNLSLHAALSHRTVARVLRMLRDEPDPLIDLVSPRRLARADRYSLRIPGRYADSVRWRRRRAGRIEAAHPAFLVLGGTSALVYQVLDQAEARGAEARPTCNANGKNGTSGTGESWRARLRTYQGARQLPSSARDGWWSLDDGDEYDEMCRWPVLAEDLVRGPPPAGARESA